MKIHMLALEHTKACCTKVASYGVDTSDLAVVDEELYAAHQ